MNAVGKKGTRLDGVGTEKADGPVSGHKCQRQNRVVHKSEPE